MSTRREFITLLGGAVVMRPLAARAQQAAQRPKIGILYPGLASALPARIAALRDALQAIGYREPDNVEFVVRSTGGDPTRIHPLAMELVERKTRFGIRSSRQRFNQQSLAAGRPSDGHIFRFSGLQQKVAAITEGSDT